MEPKPPTNIHSWKDWPKDVVETLRAWNHYSVQRLRFPYLRDGFTCSSCGSLCASHGSGGDAALDKRNYCDDCLIAHVRSYNVLRKSMLANEAFLEGTTEGMADLAAGRYDIAQRPS